MSENKEQVVGPGKFVAFTYRLYNTADNTLLFEAKEDAPDVMVYGVSHEIIPGLIAAVKDLKAGDKFEVELPPQAAFGERYPENVVELEKEIFMRDGALVSEVTVGVELPMMTAEGYPIKGRVLEITPDHVKMDFNHPFAGLTVKFDGEVREVRDATPEELQPVHGCGCGCDHDHCGEGGCGEHHHDGEGSCCNGGCC